MKRYYEMVCRGSLFFAVLCAVTKQSFAADVPNSATILQDLKSFRQMATVLMIAAHPDDENTQLITYLARGRGYRMGYLSVTRGDGGQNLLGPEFGEQLGAIRTQELLAARRLDGGRQFFTRAIDFGYSKDFQETLRTWDRSAVLGDVVRILRTFRPDVVVTRFSTQPSPGQHGQHTSSAVLGVEAFRLSGDPSAYPEQLVGDIKPWKPKRILLNGGGGARGAPASAASGAVRMDVSGTDPVMGISYAEIAGRSRGMHKSQGFGAGTGGGGGARSESFQLLDGEPATTDIMDGVDTTWARVSGGTEVGLLVDNAIGKFNSEKPSDSIPALLDIHRKLSALAADPIIKEKRSRLDQIIQACLGLTVTTTVPAAKVLPGQAVKLSHSAKKTSSVPVRWIGVRYPSINVSILNNPIVLNLAETATAESTQKLPANIPLTTPYWLKNEHPTGIFQVDDASLIGTPENLPAFPVEQLFEVDGQTLVLNDQPVQAAGGSDAKDQGRHLEVIAPVSLRFLSDVRLFVPGATKPVEVEVTAHQENATGVAGLDIPPGWKVDPAVRQFRIAESGKSTKISFNITAPSSPAAADIGVHALVNGGTFNSQQIEIRYDHIPVILLQPTAKIRAVALDLNIKGHSIGYVPGAGDNVADCIAQMGYDVTELSPADLTAEKLKAFDAVVFGVRAFNANVRTDLAPRLDAVYAYMEAGGTVIAQYNRPETGATVRIGPYPVRLSADRITDEKAAPTFLVPGHAAFNTPNKISPADFDGWVQERGIYFPNQWDEHFTPLLAFSDPGEQPQKGALLVAPYGKGYFVYSGLVWFRELPAGVPGAYRLFANLLSLGK